MVLGKWFLDNGFLKKRFEENGFGKMVLYSLVVNMFLKKVLGKWLVNMFLKKVLGKWFEEKKFYMMNC